MTKWRVQEGSAVESTRMKMESKLEPGVEKNIGGRPVRI
jgi:hypothetical protein